MNDEINKLKKLIDEIPADKKEMLKEYIRRIEGGEKITKETALSGNIKVLNETLDQLSDQEKAEAIKFVKERINMNLRPVRDQSSNRQKKRRHKSRPEEDAESN